MKLSTALLATLGRRELNAVIDSGLISKGDQRVITALRAGDPSGETAKERIFSTLRKHRLEKSEAMRSALGAYAYQRAIEMLKETAPMPSLPEQQVNKAHETQRLLHDAIVGYQREHNCSRATAIDAVLLSPQVGELHKAERRVTELQKAKNTLPQPRSTADIDFSSPLRATPGYDRTKDARPPHNPDSGENPIIAITTKSSMTSSQANCYGMIPRSRRWLRSNASASSRTTDICRSRMRFGDWRATSRSASSVSD